MGDFGKRISNPNRMDDGQEAAGSHLNRVKMRVRYAESKQVKEMREKFEKAEKHALRSSKTYKTIAKSKRDKLTEISEMARRGGGESYIDSSRGIAVGMGAEDIKTHMDEFKEELSLGQRLTDTDILELHILIEQASHEIRQYRPETALQYLNKGLKKDPQCIDILELKGRCFVNMNQHEKALESADNILITLRYPANSKALTVKGEALYNMGDFEHALVCFHRAMKTASTKEKVALEEGINIAKLAVFNAVGSQGVNYFRNLDRILTQLPCTIMGMTWHQVKAYLNNKQTKKGKRHSRHKDRKFLDALATDKFYLENMIKHLSSDVRVTSRGSKHIITEAEDALDFLVDRRDFWSQQKPDYPNGAREEIGGRETWDAVVTRLISKEPVTPFRAEHEQYDVSNVKTSNFINNI